MAGDSHSSSSSSVSHVVSLVEELQQGRKERELGSILKALEQDCQEVCGPKDHEILLRCWL